MRKTSFIIEKRKMDWDTKSWYYWKGRVFLCEEVANMFGCNSTNAKFTISKSPFKGSKMFKLNFTHPHWYWYKPDATIGWVFSKLGEQLTDLGCTNKVYAKVEAI